MKEAKIWWSNIHICLHKILHTHFPLNSCSDFSLIASLNEIWQTHHWISPIIMVTIQLILQIRAFWQWNWRLLIMCTRKQCINLGHPKQTGMYCHLLFGTVISSISFHFQSVLIWGNSGSGAFCAQLLNPINN